MDQSETIPEVPQSKYLENWMTDLWVATSKKYNKEGVLHM